MRKNIFFLICLLLTPAMVCSEVLTLDQCLERGLELNPQIQADLLAIDEAQEGVHEAWGAFFPTLSIDYGYTQLENTGDIGGDNDYLSQQSDNLTARLSQPLFTGFSGLAGVKRARESRSYREHELRLMRLQLVRAIRSHFYDILQAEQIVGKWTESVKRLKNQQQIAEAWVAQELAPRSRLLAIAVELSYAEQQLASAEANMLIGKAMLTEMIALPATEELTIVGNLQSFSLPSCDSVDVCMEQALQQHPEIKLADLNIALARKDLTMVRARNLPRVSLDASWVDYQREYDNSSVSQENRDYYTLALNVSMRPFQGGKTFFAYRKQKLAIQRLERERSQRGNAIISAVKSRYHQLVAGDSRLKSATRGVDEAREAYLFADRSVNLGISSLDDLLGAELRLTQAEINKIQAEHALQQARVQLEYAVGIHN